MVYTVFCLTSLFTDLNYANCAEGLFKLLLLSNRTSFQSKFTSYNRLSKDIATCYIGASFATSILHIQFIDLLHNIDRNMKNY